MIAVPEGDPKIKNDNNVEVDIAKGNGKSREVVDDEGNKAEEIENGKREVDREDADEDAMEITFLVLQVENVHKVVKYSVRRQRPCHHFYNKQFEKRGSLYTSAKIDRSSFRLSFHPNQRIRL
jgi:hypothetical protein